MRRVPGERITRGERLLLEHCLAGRSERASAALRLEQQLGSQLARRLVTALAGQPGQQSARARSASQIC